MNNSYWFKSGFYTLSEKGASMLFGFGGAVLLYRAIPNQADFGVWVLFLGIVSIIEVGRIGLLQNALVKYLSVDTKGEEAGKITTASIVLNGLLTLLIVLICLILSPVAARVFDAPILAKLFSIYCLTTIALIPFYQCNYIQQANLDFRGIFWGNVVKGGVLFGFILYQFIEKTPIKLESLASTQVVAAVLASIVSWIFARNYAIFSRKIDWNWVSKLFSYGIFVFGTNISTQLYKTVDKLLLGSLGGTAVVAIYDAAIRITNLTDVPTASMASMLFPQSSRRVNEGNTAIKQLYEKAVGAILAFMVPCILGVMLLANWLIYLTAGSAYSEAANLLRVTILFGLFLPYAVQFGTVLDSIGKPIVNFFYTLFSLLLTALLNWLLIPKMGAMGAAVGTLTAYAITFVFMQVYLHKILNTNPLNPFVHMVEFYGRCWNYAKQKLRNVEPNNATKEILEHEMEKIGQN
ncbi:MAG: oligosaccharide flippase family protein [Bacteroidetes bacterium]|nr:oligosaccharide flippase family protein [Bacteroidota bacterium]